MKYFLVVLIILTSIQTLLAQVEEVGIAPVVEEVMYEEPATGVRTFYENGFTGVKNYSTNSIIVPAEYQSITQVDDYNFIVKKTAYGVFHSLENKLVLPLEFDEIKFMHRKDHFKFTDSTQFVIIVKKGGKYGMMDQNYQYFMNCEYDKIESSSRFVKLVKGGKAGVYFLDRHSKDIALIYDKIDQPYDIRHIIATRGDRYSLFSQTGKLVVEDSKAISVYRDQAQQRMDNKILIVDQKGKCGIYDSKEDAYLIQVKYDAITDGFEDHFVVKKKSQYGVVTKGDKPVVPFSYDSLVFLFPKNLQSPLLAARKGKFGLVDLSNKVVADFQYDELKTINGFYKARIQGKYTVLDHSGKSITTSVFDDVGALYFGKMAVFNDGKFGYIDVNGKIVEPIDRISPARGYKDINQLFEAFAKVIRTDNDSLVMEFCRDVVYDAYTQELFQRIRYQYRGFPNKMLEKKFTVEDAAREYNKTVTNFRRRLKEAGQVESFEFVKLKNPGFDYFDRDRGLRGTETWGVFKTNARNLEIKLGELMDCDGYWKSFTNFRW